jgi:hypothetical protein
LEPLGGIQTLTGYAAEEVSWRIKEMDVTNGVVAVRAHLGEHNHQALCGIMGKLEEEVRMPTDEEIGTAFDP